MSDCVLNLFQRLNWTYTYRFFWRLYTHLHGNILRYFNVSGVPNLSIFLMSHTKIWKRCQYIISSVCRWTSNVCPYQFSRRYLSQQESYEGGGRPFWPTLVSTSVYFLFLFHFRAILFRSVSIFEVAPLLITHLRLLLIICSVYINYVAK